MGKNPKVIVLGLDGLEYNFVEEWSLKNIMQKKYCKMDLSEYKVIVTPPIWGSMLTGKIDHEIMDIWIKRCQILGTEEKVEQKWWAKIGSKILPPSVAFWIWKKIIKPLLGFEGNAFEITSNYVMEKNEKNIFDYFEKPWTNTIPGYNYEIEDLRKEKKLLNEALTGDKKLYINYLTKKYKDDKIQLMMMLEKKSSDIIFWYTRLVDSICHTYRIKPIKLMNYYLELNNLVGKVKKKCPHSIVYVVSDHGMESGQVYWYHSTHAFFSSNTGETIEKPTQLYDLIRNHRTIERKTI